MQSARPNPPTICRRSLTLVKRPVPPAPSPEEGSAASAPVLHFVALHNLRGKYLQFHSFDESYVSRLRSGDFRTQEHFSAYFSALIKIKLGSRLKSPDAVDDVRQEVFARFLWPCATGRFFNPTAWDHS